MSLCEFTLFKLTCIDIYFKTVLEDKSGLQCITPCFILREISCTLLCRLPMYSMCILWNLKHLAACFRCQTIHADLLLSQISTETTPTDSLSSLVATCFMGNRCFLALNHIISQFSQWALHHAAAAAPIISRQYLSEAEWPWQAWVISLSFWWSSVRFA